ncbi:uncharacterized protein [Rutidosis leptorrhynchoides]|uniref:uncharacterized protein n=1 Tax=Rutidosis leptorrhynchoides TaxID=125765 RepID=UPI003A98EF1B
MDYEMRKDHVFSISINGQLHGFFKGKRGLRQGDPMSPYLNTLVMEVLTLMLQLHAQESGAFRFHPKCEKLGIINVCFADDLFLFSHANTNSVSIIAATLEEFKQCSGLAPSMEKSMAFFANVSQIIKNAILTILPFDEGKLPVRYLGVPLVSSSLLHHGCKVLVDRVRCKIQDWKNKFLSFVGRVQLIISVLTSMPIYWQSVSMLPKAIIKEIEALMRDFLWIQGEYKRGKAKVKWSTVCLPRDEGGLGIKRFNEWNRGLMTSHIWFLLTCKESLWVQWVHAYHLRGTNFWRLPKVAGASVGWRKLLAIRDMVLDRFIYKIGDRTSISAWHDCWCDLGPLDKVISNRAIHSAGFNHNTTVSEIVSDGGWTWPSNCGILYPQLQHVSVLLLHHGSDVVQWHNYEGDLQDFRVSSVWQVLRNRADQAVVDSLCPIAAKRNDPIIMSKLMFGATVYNIWRERNDRLFKKKSKSPSQVFDDIFAVIRLKIMSIKWKNSSQVQEMKADWKVP